MVTWWTPWLCSFRMSPRDPTLLFHELRLPLAALQRPPRDELDARLDDQYVAQASADGVRERVVRSRVAGELDADRKRRLLLHARRPRADEDVAAHVGRERAHDLANGGREEV